MITLSEFLALNFNLFIIEYVAESHFAPVLKTLFWEPNFSIVGCGLILEIVGRYYPQNIWYFEFAENYYF